MADDARYTLKSAAWDCYDWEKKETHFFIDATYRRISDDDEASAPWNLAPFNINVQNSEQAVPFRMAYNEQNVKCIPVVNTAGDPLEAQTVENITEYTFSFYARSYTMSDIDTYSDTVNASAQKLLGRTCAAGTLLLTKISVTPMITYEDDGYTEKWRYYQVDMLIRHNPNGWLADLLNVGHRARFVHGSGQTPNMPPELIYQFYDLDQNTGRLKTTPEWTSAEVYYSKAKAYLDWIDKNPEAAKLLPSRLPYEYGDNIPLNADGTVNTTVLGQDIANPNYSGYPHREFKQYKSVSWSGLDLPTDIKRRWR